MKATSGDERLFDYPAPETYNRFTLEQIKALCEIDIPMNQMHRLMPDWETMSESLQRFYRLKAYWALRGAKDPGYAAAMQPMVVEPYDKKWHIYCVARGWRYWRPTCLRELEKEFLPAPMPSIHSIIKRCPQMAMIHALRGDAYEPFWWAALSITEHATPNLSRECSDGYPGFSDEELSERVARIHREKKKPALCARLNNINSNVCAGCKFQGSIKSPIALGFEHEPKCGKGSP